MLTEPQAWREIARRIVEGEWAMEGLCFEGTRLWLQSRISDSTEIAMWKRIKPHTAHALDRYLAPPGEEPEARALFALLMAEIAEDEAHA